MTINLENVDVIRERTGASYKEAKEALEHANGDVLEAIIYLEEKPTGTDNFTKGVHDFGKDFGKGVQGFGVDVIAKLKDMIKKGNITRITLEKDNKVIIDIPVNVGAVGAVLFPPATVVAVIAALATGCAMKITKTDGETIDLKEVTTDALKKAMDKVDSTVEDVKHAFDKEGCDCNCDCSSEDEEEKSCEDGSCCSDYDCDDDSCCGGDKEEVSIEIEPKDE